MLSHDFKSAIRSLLKSRGYTMVAVASLGLAIGATTAGLSIVNALFARDVAIAEPQQLVSIAKVEKDKPDDRSPLLLTQFEAIRREHKCSRTCSVGEMHCCEISKRAARDSRQCQ